MSGTASLEKLKLWAQIVSSIAIPVVLAVVGYHVQRSVADNELAKNYVQIAIDILRNPPTPEAGEWRRWAVATFERHSPVPLSPELRDQLMKHPIELRGAARVETTSNVTLTTAPAGQ